MQPQHTVRCNGRRGQSCSSGPELWGQLPPQVHLDARRGQGGRDPVRRCALTAHARPRLRAATLPACWADHARVRRPPPAFHPRRALAAPPLRTSRRPALAQHAARVACPLVGPSCSLAARPKTISKVAPVAPSTNSWVQGFREQLLIRAPSPRVQALAQHEGGATPTPPPRRPPPPPIPPPPFPPPPPPSPPPSPPSPSPFAALLAALAALASLATPHAASLSPPPSSPPPTPVCAAVAAVAALIAPSAAVDVAAVAAAAARAFKGLAGHRRGVEGEGARAPNQSVFFSCAARRLFFVLCVVLVFVLGSVKPLGSVRE